MLFRLTLAIVLFASTLFSQSHETLTIYLDCNEWICDKPFIKQELENVNFVRDQSDADVHIFFVTQPTANRGRSFEIEFIGQKYYKKFHDNLKFTVNGDMTELQSSEMILKYLRLGLMRFWIENGMGDKLSLTVEKEEKEDVEETDLWKKWSFSISGYGWFNGQESYSSSNLNGSVSVEQITDNNKFRLRIGTSIRRSVFTTEEGEKIISDKKEKYVSAKDVISINKHWSTGLFTRFGSSVYGNYTFYSVIEPGIEYDFFPYSVSSKRQLVLFYKIGSRYNNYIETTSFGKKYELLWLQSLGIGGLIKRKWGSFEGSVIYEHFLHNLSLNNLDFFLSTRIRVFKGLSFRVSGGYSIIHNQVNIAASGTTREELLLQQKQLLSGFDYWFNTGITYQFGSIFNTIVNSRFDY